MSASQKKQKQWYDRHTRVRTLQPGDQVLIMLPSAFGTRLSQETMQPCIRQPPYRLPLAWRGQVEQELGHVGAGNYRTI